MKFEKYDILAQILELDDIEEGKFDNFDLKNISQYRSHIRRLFRDFKRELEQELRDSISEGDTITLFYILGDMETTLRYHYKERENLEEKYNDFITPNNIILYFRFFDQKQWIIRKTISLIQVQKDAITKGQKVYKQIKKKLELQAIKTKTIANRNHYFSWKRSPESREKLFDALKSKKFIDIDTDFELFEKAFVIFPAKIPKNTVPFAIKWVDKNVNKTYTKKSLVYLIEEMVRLEIIVNPNTANKRNKIISFLFSHDGETRLTRLSENIERSKPKRKADIDKILKSLGNV